MMHRCSILKVCFIVLLSLLCSTNSFSHDAYGNDEFDALQQEYEEMLRQYVDFATLDISVDESCGVILKNSVKVINILSDKYPLGYALVVLRDSSEFAEFILTHTDSSRIKISWDELRINSFNKKDIDATFPQFQIDSKIATVGNYFNIPRSNTIKTSYFATQNYNLIISGGASKKDCLVVVIGIKKSNQ